MDRFQGDPKLTLTEDGADMKFIGGQPVMDQGLENHILISLFTQRDWPGNYLIDAVDHRPGSDFEVIAKGPITLSHLNDVRQAAEAAIKNPAIGKADISVSNPNSNYTSVSIVLHPPGSDSEELLISKNGVNWFNQAKNPAYARI